MLHSKRIVMAVILTLLPCLTLAGTLDEVLQRGKLRCGINEGLNGFSDKDEGSHWAGIDVDFCRGIAAAIFADDTKVDFVPLTAKERFSALVAGDVDVLSRNSTWTLTRDTYDGIDFVGVNFYDGQGFMVRKSLNIKSAAELSDKSICVIQATTTAQNLRDYFKARGMKQQPVFVETNEEAVQAYQSGKCQAYTGDRSALAAQRVKLDNRDDHVILADVISKEPLGPAVSHGDNQWADIVRWTLFAMIAAEELGVSSANVDDMRANSDNPEIARLLGNEGDLGEKLGLSKDWAYNIVLLVGNYGEVYANNVGPDSAVGLDRGLNRLWTEGGLMYAPPIR